MDVLLKAQGYTKGSLRDRLNALGKAEGQLFANNDAGRAEMLAYLNGLLVKVRDRLPQVFSRMPKAPYEIRRVPPAIEIGRSEEQTSELQSIMRISHDVFCLQK